MIVVSRPDGTLYTSGQLGGAAGAGACEVCNPAVSTSTFQPVAEGTTCGSGTICTGALGVCAADCYVGGTLYTSGQLGGASGNNACEVCTPSVSTSAFQAVAEGTTCGSGTICTGALATCAADCFIGGTLYTSGQLGGASGNNACEVCTPSVSTSAFQAVAEGTTCGSGTICTGALATCAADCYVGGALYTSGAANPGNQCQSCQPGTSTSAFTNDASGTACNDGNPCTSPDTCNGSGTCSGTTVAAGTSCGTGEICNGTSCVVECYVGGVFYAAGQLGAASGNGACEVCTPPTSTTAFQAEPAGTFCAAGEVCTGAVGVCASECFIGGALVAAGAVNPGNSCQTCQPSVSTSAYTNVGAGGNTSSCLASAGDVCSGAGSCVNECYIGGALVAAGAVSSGNSCQTCQPSVSTTTYTNVAVGGNTSSCTAAAGDVCNGSGSCVNDCYIGGSLVANGAVSSGNSCQTCQPSVSTTTYSNVAVGGNTSSCTAAAGDVCNGSGSCVNDCYISGVGLVANGAVSAGNSCQTCQPSVSTTSYTSVAAGGNTTTCLASAGDVCNGTGSCVNDCFIGGTGLVANGTTNPGNQCQSCQPSVSTTSYSNKASGTSCNDGNNCTYNDVCNGSGTCAGTAITCTPGTCQATSTCNGTSSCTITYSASGTSCNDGNACTYNDVCNGSGTCAGTPITCSPGTCQASSTCNGTSSCSITYSASGTSCNDGNNCTYNDVCNGSGSCAGTPITCSPTQCQSSSTCNGTSSCTIVNKASGSSCNDGNNCTYNDVCNGSGTCAGTPITCSPGTCQASSTCNGTSSCSITYSGSGTACNDGNACTYNDVCNGAGTCAGTPITCSPGTCQASSTCNGTSSCSITYSGSGTACNDGNNCTYNDVCNGAGTCAGTPITCSPGTCQASSTCNGTSSCTITYSGSGTACNDGNNCTYNDVCNGAGTCAGTPITCSPNQCQSSSTCNGTSSCTIVNKASGSACNDGNNCTYNDVCNGSGTCAGTAITCSPGTCQASSTCNGTSSCSITYSASGTACTGNGDTCDSFTCNGSGTCNATYLGNGATCGSGETCCPAGETMDCAKVCGGTATTDCIGHCCGGTTGVPCATSACNGCCGGYTGAGCYYENTCPGSAPSWCGGSCGIGNYAGCQPYEYCCPFIYSEGADGFAYETSVGGGSLIGTAADLEHGNATQFSPMWARLDRAAVKKGSASAKILIAEDEIAYVDEAHLTVVEHPVGYEILSSSSLDVRGLAPQAFYALRTAAFRTPVSASWMGREDVTKGLGSLDDEAVAYDLTTDNYYDLDFGAVKDPRNARLVIDGWKHQTQRNLAAGVPDRGPRLEVEQADGRFKTVLEFAYPRGDRKAVTFDLSSVEWPAGAYRMRIWTGTTHGTAMWYLDRVRLTEEAPVATHEENIAPSVASLSFSGAPELLWSLDRPRESVPNGAGELDASKLGYGQFTRYGDVRELLGAVDDMLVVMRKGDVVDLSFERIPAPKKGLTQTLFLRTELLYKPVVCPDCEGPTDLSRNVLPLPFHGMTRYPYPSDEHYPTDAAHQRLLEQYLSREYQAGDTRWGP